MSIMWNLSEIKKRKTVSAKNIVEEQCAELKEITGNKVIGVLRTYNGKYRSESNIQINALENIGAQFNVCSVDNFDVQDVLGSKIEGGEFVYEFYLTAKVTPNYKYTVFLLYYDWRLFPVGLSIDQSIADEIKCKTEFEVKNEAEFKEVLARILSCKTITNVINNLLSF